MRGPSKIGAFANVMTRQTSGSSLLTVDQGLAAAGVAAAIGSATFAAYMITRDNSHPVFGGAEHLMLFARPLGAGELPKQIGADRAEERPVDYSATGSIRQGGLESRSDNAIERRADAAPVLRNDKIQAGPQEATLKGYVLRFVHKGVAFVQSAQGSFVVARGALLPGAGRVHSIEKRADGWVVVTAGGLIAE